MKKLLPLVAALAFMAPMASQAATVVPYYASGYGYYGGYGYYASPIAYSAPLSYAYGYNNISWAGPATVPVFGVSGSPILTSAGWPVANYTRPIAYTAPAVSYVAPAAVATPVSYVAPARLVMGSPVVSWGEVIGESRY